MQAPRVSNRVFGLTSAFVFGGICGAGWLFWETWLSWAAAISAFFLASGIIAPGLLLPINRLFAWLGSCIGRLNNTVLLSLFYYLFVFAAGLALRILGKDPMERKWDGRIPTYWKGVRSDVNSGRYNDMF